MDKSLFDAYVVEAELLRADANVSHQKLEWFRSALVEQELLAPFPIMCGNVRLGISVGAGWLPTLREALGQIDRLMVDNPGFIVLFEQIKEKFGGLRMYCRIFSVNENNEAERGEYGLPKLDPKHEELSKQVFQIICKAEDACSTICEVCGQPGKEHQSRSAYIHTACDKHRIK